MSCTLDAGTLSVIGAKSKTCDDKFAPRAPLFRARVVHVFRSGSNRLAYREYFQLRIQSAGPDHGAQLCEQLSQTTTVRGRLPFWRHRTRLCTRLCMRLRQLDLSVPPPRREMTHERPVQGNWYRVLLNNQQQQQQQRPRSQSSRAECRSRQGRHLQIWIRK